jgi:hypothetical protein
MLLTYNAAVTRVYVSRQIMPSAMPPPSAPCSGLSTVAFRPSRPLHVERFRRSQQNFE